MGITFGPGQCVIFLANTSGGEHNGVTSDVSDEINVIGTKVLTKLETICKLLFT